MTSSSVHGPVGSHPRREELVALGAQAAVGEMTPLGGHHRFDADVAAGYRRSAVLALFAPAARPVPDRGGDLDLFLVQRSPLLRHHPGQIALPGGGIEQAETEVDAALRETEEEIGVPRSLLDPLGALPPVLVPFSKNVVTPVLGWTERPVLQQPATPQEVLRTLRVPLATLLDPDRRSSVVISHGASAGFRLQAGWVWGFTGNLLSHLFDELGWSRPWPREREYVMSLAEATGQHIGRDG